MHLSTNILHQTSEGRGALFMSLALKYLTMSVLKHQSYAVLLVDSQISFIIFREE